MDENEGKKVLNFLLSLRPEMDKRIDFLSLKLIFNPNDFISELGNKILSISESDFKLKEHRFNGIIPNIKNDKDLFLRSLFIKTQISDFIYAISESEKIAKHVFEATYPEQISKYISQLTELKESISEEVNGRAAELLLENTANQSYKPQRIFSKNLSDFHFAIDKVNSSIWSNKNDISKTEITIPLKAEPDTSKMQVTNNVVLWLDELKNNTAVQRLTQYDLRVYMAIGNLFEVGNTKVSVKDIYKAMGNNNNPAPDQRKRILLAVEKMSSIRITIDTSEEEQAGYNYPNLHIKRRNLLYTKLDIVLKNGQETEAIELMEEPVLFQFALTRNQYTTIPAKLLCSPINKTEATLAIENYLIKRITERGKANGTILLSTVYEKASIIEKKQKQRAKVKIKTLLEYWKEQGFIANYDVCMNDNKSKQEECIKFKR